MHVHWPRRPWRGPAWPGAGPGRRPAVSPDRGRQHLRHGLRLPAQGLPAERCWQPPVLRASVEEVVQAIARAVDADPAEWIRYVPEAHIETLFGRRCHLPGINDKNAARRQFSERAAINAPLQGTAADIIKRAMVAVDGLLTSPSGEAGINSAMRDSSPLAGEVRWGGVNGGNTYPAHPLTPTLSREGRGSYARLLLQVHDELIIEAPTADAPAIAAQVKRAMEQVAHLSIPLTVETGIGSHWGAAH